jgi:hypothetical protein
LRGKLPYDEAVVAIRHDRHGVPPLGKTLAQEYQDPIDAEPEQESLMTDQNVHDFTLSVGPPAIRVTHLYAGR